MPNKHLIVIAYCCFPLLAHAEVLDKLPLVQDMWLHATLGVLVAYIALRIHWGLFAAALVYPALWFTGLLMDLYSFDLGPAIAAEAGQQYSINAHAAAFAWLLGVAASVAWSLLKKPGNYKVRN